MNGKEESPPVDLALAASGDLRGKGRLAMLKRSFHHRNYRLYFAGQLVSLIGTWMQTVSQSWLVYRLTGSAALLGLVGFASQIPILVLSPIGGAVAGCGGQGKGAGRGRALGHFRHRIQGLRSDPC